MVQLYVSRVDAGLRLVFEPGAPRLLPALLSAGLVAVWGGRAGVWGEVLSTGVWVSLSHSFPSVDLASRSTLSQLSLCPLT